MSFRAVFLTFSTLIAIAIIGGVSYLWYQSRGARGLDVILTVPEEISSGIPFTLEAKASNESSSVLKNVELTIELPEGVVFVGSAPDKNFSTKSIGTLGSGSIAEESFELLALGGLEEVKEVRATLTYTPESLQSKFEKEVTSTFTLRESGLVIDLALPEQVFGGEEFEMVATYRNNSDTDFENVRLRMVYPPAFSFKSASPKPDLQNAVWDLGGIPSKADGEIKIRGSLIGADGSFFDLKAQIEAQFLGRSYTVSERSASLLIAKSPLSVEIQHDRPNEFPLPGETMFYHVRITNNTDIGLSDVSVRAQLVGTMFDLTSLQSNGSLRAIDNAVVWNVANTPALSFLSPGASQEVLFNIRLKSPYPIKRLSDKNFTLKVNATAESPTVPQAVSAQKTLGIASKETKVSGTVGIDARGFFRDATSGILNKGPWPIQVGKPTNFTIHWVLTNYATDVQNVEARAFLGPNVRFTGVAKSNTGAIPSYNATTQEVVWNVGNVNAGKGVIGTPAEATFQIEITPSVNQVGTSVVLLQGTSLRAFDSWIEQNLSASDVEVRSASLDDTTVTSNEGIVLP